MRVKFQINKDKELQDYLENIGGCTIFLGQLWLVLTVELTATCFPGSENQSKFLVDNSNLNFPC